MYNPTSEFWICPRDLLPVGHVWKASKGSCPGEILIRCQNHLHWLAWIQRSSGFTLSSPYVTELQALSVRLSLAFLLWKLISVVCIITHHNYRWLVEGKQTSKLKALPLYLSFVFTTTKWTNVYITGYNTLICWSISCSILSSILNKTDTYTPPPEAEIYCKM